MKKILIILCSITLLTSCGTSRRTPKGTDFAEEIQKTNIEKQRYEAALSKYIDFDNLQAKAKYTLGGKSLGGKLYVEHGKRLCLTVAVLGIEVARIEANNEEVTIVDKFDKKYSVLPINEFADKFGMEEEMKYEALEALLLGQIFLPEKGIAENKDFNSFTWDIADEDVLFGSFKKEKYTLSYKLDSLNILKETSVEAKYDGKDAKIGYAYSDFHQFDKGIVPTSAEIQLLGGDLDVNAALSLSNVSVSAKPWKSFKPNANYEKVELKELIAAIKQMNN